MQTQLRARLVADTAIAGLCVTNGETRVDWGVRPQAKGLPAITLTLITDYREQHMGGLETTQGPLVQVDCWAATYLDSVTLREAVISLLATPAIQGSTIFLGAQNIMSQDLPEGIETGIVHRAMIRANVWHTT